MRQIKNIRCDFPILDRLIHDHPLVYLDNAATTLKPQCVGEAVLKYYQWETANIHRGVHHLSEQATLAFESVRGKVAEFINAPSEKQIIFTAGTTDSINIIAQSYGEKFIGADDEIIISEMEHHSNIVPWQILARRLQCKIKVIPMNDQGELDQTQFEQLINPKTKLLAITHVSNSLGTINPIKKMIAVAHQKGVPVLIDGAQAVVKQDINVSELDCDFYVFSAHKMFGPTGVGILYGKMELLEEMPPVKGGGDMIERVTFEKTSFREAPHKFEAGTPNISGVIGFGAALDYIRELDLTAVRQHEQQLLKEATERVLQIEGVRIIGEAAHKVAILSMDIQGVHPHDVGTLLDEEGVAVRAGHHCTQPVMDRFNLPATTRASFSIYNTSQDIDTLCQGILKIKELFNG